MSSRRDDRAQARGSASPRPARARALARLLLFLSGFVFFTAAPALSVQQSSFNHDQTGFPLRDAHRLLDCETCHMFGTFAGTPTECLACHRMGQIAATYRPASHMPTTDRCEACHSAKDWTTVVWTDHKEVEPVRCDTCHNGETAEAKPAGHPPTRSDCGTCHTTTTFESGIFDHTGITSDCVRCHNNRDAQGKDPGHLPTSDRCEDCHTPGSWWGARFDHADIIPGTSCATCHDGVHANGKSPTHIATSEDCGACHSTQSWNSAVFNHAGVTGNCVQCHDGTHATGKGPAHLRTSNVCESCHTPLAWSPATRVDHSQVSGVCSSCHDGAVHDGITITGRPATTANGSPHPPTGECSECHVPGDPSWVANPHTPANLAKGCVSCHDGRTASGRAASHLATTTLCESCHTIAGWSPYQTMDHSQVRALTPCIACHDGGIHDGLLVEGKGSTHLPTFADCGSCHAVTGWSPITGFDHAGVNGSCVTCHSGAYPPAQGKDPAKHIPSSSLCQACHDSTASWTPLTPARVDHTQVSGTCSTCHGTALTLESMTTETKPPGHVPTTSECSVCHSTSAWRPASGFDHAGITSGCAASGCHQDGRTSSPLGRGPNHIATNTNCQDCHAIGVAFTPHTTVVHADLTTLTPCSACHDGTVHDGITITGKKATHIPTTADCAGCHVGAETRLSWVGGNFDHAGTTSGCANCHDGTHEQGKPVGHIPTTADCATCHVGAQNTLSWAGGVFSHAGISTGCASCHDGAHPPALGKGPDHVGSSPACELCHTDSAITLLWTSSPTAGHLDHTLLTSVTPCTKCHATTAGSTLTIDGMTVTGRPLTTASGDLHPATGDCGSCHRTTSWTGVTFSHSGITSGCAASGCHTDGNVTPPLGRSAQHFATNTNCQDCHSIGGAFTPHKAVNHADFTVLKPCGACHDGAVHDGITVTGKHTNHIPTSKDCAVCHAGAETSLSWIGGTFDHTGTTTGCATCHDGFREQGKGPAHIASTAICEACHTNSATTLSWTSSPLAGQVDHAQITTPVPCTTCHATSAGTSYTIDGMTVTGRPVKTAAGTTHPTTGDCAGCHSTSNWTAAAFDHSGISSGCTAAGCHRDGNTSPPLGRGPNHIGTNTNCQDCHSIGGTFTPHTTVKHSDITALTPCAACHDGSVRDGITITGKNPGHIPTTIPAATDCVTCHAGADTSLSWLGGAYHSHVTATSGCTGCHDGSFTAAGAQAKGPNHIATSTRCEACHDTANWSPVARVDHREVTGTCISCHDGGVHDGLTIKGKGPQHIASSNACDGCHMDSASTLSWTTSPTVGNVNHALITTTIPCTNCHATAAGTSLTIDGMVVTGRPLTVAGGGAHPASGSCDTCHSTSTWTGATFDHAGITGGCAASGCHTDGRTSPPLGRSASHLATNTQCEDCHTAGGSFTPQTTVKHADLLALQPCGSCHDGGVHGGVTVTGKSSNHIPTTIPAASDCVVCHVGADVGLSWTGGAYHAHVDVQSGCSTCHAGGYLAAGAEAKGPAHIATSNQCETCHGTSGWRPVVRVDHTQVSGTCYSCHDGAVHDGLLIPGKGPQHIGTSNACDGCHTDSASTLSWTTTPIAGNVNHTLITSTTPCTTCHATGAGSSLTIDGMTIQGRPVNTASGPHVATGDCVSCHSTSTWVPAIAFDHGGVVTGCAASGCHQDGNTSPPLGRGAAHIPTTTSCEDCHNIGVSFTPYVTVKHADITALRPCASCHNGTVRDGITISGTGSGHIPVNVPTANDCEVCHVGADTSLTWSTGAYHSRVTVTTGCVNCHSGSYKSAGADGKSTNHIASSNNCEKCHSTASFSPATTVDHNELSLGAGCYGCHNGTIASGKGPLHIGTSNTCDSCHRSSAATLLWVPVAASDVDHTQITTLVPCFRCHDGGTHDGAVIEGKDALHLATSNLCENCHNGNARNPSWAIPVSSAVKHTDVIGTCFSCHKDNSTNTTGLGTPIQGRNTAQHINTNTVCEDCHSTSGWSPYTHVNHADVVGTCTSCHDGLVHDGITIQGRPSDAVHSNPATVGKQCDECHSTTTWATTIFDHTGITTGCANCHNGTLATGRPSDSFHLQVKASAGCETCHLSTLAWTPVTAVDHTQLTSTTPCSNCHNGTVATAKPSDTIHNGTSADCVNCHSTTSWVVTHFDHTGITGGCSNCHNGTTATGKDQSTHFVTTRDCNYCHSTSTWTTLIFKHASANFVTWRLDSHRGYASFACTACHTGNAESSAYKSSGIAYAPYCAACHTAQWKADSHKTHLPDPTIAGHKDCSASCHDATRTWPAGVHKVTDSQFSGP